MVRIRELVAEAWRVCKRRVDPGPARIAKAQGYKTVEEYRVDRGDRSIGIKEEGR